MLAILDDHTNFLGSKGPDRIAAEEFSVTAEPALQLMILPGAARSNGPHSQLKIFLGDGEK